MTILHDIDNNMCGSTGNCKSKGNTNMKCLDGALGHDEPEQLQWCIDSKSVWTLLEGCDTIRTWEIPSFGVLLMVVESAVPELPNKCYIGWRSGDWDGHGIWFTLCSCSSNHLGTRALWIGTLSSYGVASYGLPSILIHDPNHDGMLKLLWDMGQHFYFWMNSVPRVNCLLLSPRC